MADRIAVLADIHGNLPALRAVLADVERVGVDLIVLNGDLADGPFPGQTLELLESLGDRAAWIRGNGDRWLVEAYDGTFAPTGGPADRVIEWAVGMPYGHTGASWALLDTEVTLRRTGYDTARADRLMSTSAMPDVREFIDEYVCSVPSDAEALEVFGKIRDEQQAGRTAS